LRGNIAIFIKNLLAKPLTRLDESFAKLSCSPA